MFLGKPWGVDVLAAAAPSNVGVLRVKLSDYPPLAQPSGSVRLGLVPLDPFFPASNPPGEFYPIIINHVTGSTYHVLDSFCSHAGCAVPAFDATERVMRCPCHFSAYAIDGSLLTGPSTRPLSKYSFTLTGTDTLNIEIPNLRFQVTASAVQAGTSKRVRLAFPTFFNVEYEVRYRSTAASSGVVTFFAPSATGIANQPSLIGNGSPATIYVDRTANTGFYTVAIKLLDLTE